MRILNIKTGYLETINIENIENKYVTISHRWLSNELNLNNFITSHTLKNINLGKFLINDLENKNKYKKDKEKNKIIEEFILKEKLTKYKNWWGVKYASISINSNIKNHIKLGKIINCIIKNNKKYIWMDTLCIDKSSSSELNKNIVGMYNIYKNSEKVYVQLCDIYKKDIFEKYNYKTDLDKMKEIKENFEYKFDENHIDNYTNNIKIEKNEKIIKNIKKIINDEWWTRGWTLQEYLANDNVIIYDNDMNFICKKKHYIFLSDLI